MIHEHFRQALEDLDVPLLRKVWAHSNSHLPQPRDDGEALIVAHMARSGSESISFKARAYSHAWLVERGYPSQLPDQLRPRAQQICPVTVPTAALAVYNRTPVALAIRTSMEHAVLDEGLKDPAKTKRAILSARAKARKQLLGVTS